MKSSFVISLFCLFQTIWDTAHTAMVVPGITTVDYYDYVNDFYDGNTTSTVISGKFGTEKNVFKISEDVFKNIGSVSDLNELQRILGIEVPPPKKVYNVFRSSLDDEMTETRSRKTVKYMDNPVQGNCIPELHSVDLGLINTEYVQYYPTCVRVNQCGGCCPNKEIISCQPTASEKVIVQVYELFPDPDRNAVSTSARSSRRRNRRTKIEVQVNKINVTVEEHTECACLCKLRESNCNLDVHLYDERACACICKNIDEENKCYEKSTHVWRKENCECLCRHVTTCSSSEEFDHSSCTCKSTNLGLPLDNVLLKNGPPWESILRRRPVSVPIRS